MSGECPGLADKEPVRNSSLHLTSEPKELS